MCDYEAEYWSLKERKNIKYICPHRPLKKMEDGGKKYCIFHSRSENKDLEVFYQGFKKLYNSKRHEFTGFVFPKDFRFERLKEETNKQLKFNEPNFAKALFLCPTDLSGTEFTGDNVTEFSGAQFSGEDFINFSKSKFSSKGGTNFGNATFSGKVKNDFSEVQFSGDGDIDFTGAEFSGEGRTTFFMSIFFGKGLTSFYGAKFKNGGGVSFMGVNFLCDEGISFLSTQFKGNYVLDFRGAIFSGKGDVSFRDTRFSNGIEVLFHMVTFSVDGEISFEGTNFPAETSSDFTNVTFKNPRNVTFSKTDLNKCLFMGTDLRHIKFHEVYWTNRKYPLQEDSDKKEIDQPHSVLDSTKVLIKKDGNVREKVKRKFIEKRIMVYDETFQAGSIFNRKGKKNHESVYRIYNQLRLNYEETGRYFDAGDFFVGSMEMRRRGDFEHRIIRIILSVYKLISLYGERPIRAFGWLIALCLIFGLIFLQIGFVKKRDIFSTIPGKEKNEYFIERVGYNDETKIQRDILLFDNYGEPLFWKDYIKAVQLSLDNLTLGRVKTPYQLSEKVISPFLQGLEVILGAVFISLFILAMNRKFRRTKD